MRYHTTSSLVAFFIILSFAVVGFGVFGLTHNQGWSDPTSENQPLAGDAGQYNVYARNLISKGIYTMGESGFDNFREPGYPFFLFTVYKIFGLFNFAAVRIIQLFLLALIGYFVYMTFLIYGEKKFGLLAGIFSVLIPYMGYYSVELTTELMFSFLLTFSFFLLIKIIKTEKANVFYYISSGLVWGYAALVRAQILLFPLMIFLVFLFFSRNSTVFKNISIKKSAVGLLLFVLITGGWATYSYSQNGSFSISEGRQELVIYYRAARSELSYKEITQYLSSWLKRSINGGGSDEFLYKYEFSDLYESYYKKASNPQQVISVRNQSIRTILSHFDKYLLGSGVEFVKLTFIEHTYAGSYNKYLRAGFYLGLYLLFLNGIFRFIFLKRKTFRLIFWLALLYLSYNYLIITALDAIPRYNAPYLVFYLLIGLIGIYPFNTADFKKAGDVLEKLDINKAIGILKNKKVAIFIVAYQAEQHIQKTIERIPKELINYLAEIYLIDDSSNDRTIEKARSAFINLGIKNYRIMRTPFNQGYGGNQKIGYRYAIKNNYDYVIMLHGDGQYPPEFIPQIIEQFDDLEVSAVFGSRMINKYQALRGGMPLYKWFGNQILTKIENAILGSRLSEFHSGYRAYSIAALKLVPFYLNSNNFHFDTDIIIQLLANNMKIVEIPIPTHYGDEICRVNGLKYFWNCLKSVIKFRFYKLGIFYQPNFDIESPLIRNYKLKKNPNSLHQYIISKTPWVKTDNVADLGANDGALAAKISPLVNNIVAVDAQNPDSHPGVKTLELDLNDDFDNVLDNNKYDKVIALDVIEHLYNPEKSMIKINNIMKTGGKLYISTANIAFIIMRATLLVGWFNYGKRGILDKTHHRLFTVNTFKRLLKNSGFKVEKVIGFGPPIADGVSNKGVAGLIDKTAGLLAGIKPSIFSFNFLVIAEKRMPFEEIHDLTVKSS